MSRAIARSALVTTSVVALVATLLVALWLVRHVLLLGFAAVLLAILLLVPTRWLAGHTPLPHGAALALVAVSLLLLVALGGWFVAPLVTEQVQQLADALPRAVDRIQSRVGRSAWADRALEDLRTALTGVVPSVLSNTVGFLTGLVVVFSVGAFLAAEPGRYRDGLVRLVPLAERERAGQVIDAVGNALRWFLVGQVASMAVVGVIVGAGLTLLGVPHARTLGLLAGLLEFIPYLGPILAFVPALLVALGESPTLALWVVVLYVFIQQVEGNVVMPLVQQRAVSLPPVVTILALVGFGTIFGFLGLLLGTPLAAVALVLVQELYLRDTLGDRRAAPEPAGRRAAAKA